MALRQNRTYDAWTTRSLSEYIAKYLPGITVQNEVKLGPIDTTGITGSSEAIVRGAASNRRSRADAIGWDASSAYLFESKSALSGAALGQMEDYVRIFWGTPELAHLQGRTLRPILLVVKGDDRLQAEATSRGIEVRIYKPVWWDSAVTSEASAREAEAESAGTTGRAGSRQKTRRNVYPTGGTSG